MRKSKQFSQTGFADPFNSSKPLDPLQIYRLLFKQSHSPINQTPANDKKFVYKIEGSRSTRITNESNLDKKIKDMDRSSIPQFQKDIKQQQGQNNKQQSIEVKKIRYFSRTDEFTQKMKCRRCGQYGHYQRNCTTAIKNVCSYCMRKHHFKACTQISCNRCNEMGHKYQDCTADNLKCYKCRKSGHSKFNCNVIVFGQELMSSQYIDDMNAVKCLNCKQKGHFKCGESKEDNLYEGFNQRNEKLYSIKPDYPKVQNNNFDLLLWQKALKKCVQEHKDQ